MAEMLVYQQVQNLLNSTSEEEIEKRGKDGLVCGKAANLDRDHVQATMQLKRQNFCETLTYDDAKFKRQYLVSHAIFACAFSAVLEKTTVMSRREMRVGSWESASI